MTSSIGEQAREPNISVCYRLGVGSSNDLLIRSRQAAHALTMYGAFEVEHGHPEVKQRACQRSSRRLSAVRKKARRSESRTG